MIFVLSMLLLLGGGSQAFAQDVRFNFDKSANFATYKTYKWVALKGAQPLNDGQLLVGRFGGLQ